MYRAGRWYCAFQVIVAGKTRPAHASRSSHPVVGVDVGVKDLLVVASPDGVEVDRVPAPKPLVFAQAKLRALQRRAARQYGPYDPASRARRDRRNGGGAPGLASHKPMPGLPKFAPTSCTPRPARWLRVTRSLWSNSKC